MVGSKVSNSDGFVSTGFTHNILGGGLALEQVYLRFVPNVLDIIVNHGQGNADGKDSDGAKSYGGISHVTVGLIPVIVFHLLLNRTVLKQIGRAHV